MILLLMIKTKGERQDKVRGGKGLIIGWCTKSLGELG